jgi:cellulose synthase/poly-beta-1,6-N-acetylglucosamine synthase-like glycosyltransferase
MLANRRAKGVAQKAEVSLEDVNCTLLVPFYNEEDRISPTLEAISLLLPQPGEIIFIDDYSTDRSASIIEQHGFQVIKNELGKGKKSALSFGISKAKYDTIVTTDADCVMPVDWLDKLYTAHQGNYLTFGLVEFNTNGQVFNYYQWLENRALMSVGQGSYWLGYPLMCNGANLMFEKSIWEEVGGYSNNLAVEGGDDVFLLHEFWLKDKSKIILQNEAYVYTHSRPSFKSFMKQRRRWANKSFHYKTTYARLFPILTAVLNIGILSSLIYLLYTEEWWWALATLVLKSLIDYLMIISPKTNGVTCVSFPMVVQFQLFQLIYPFFLIFYQSDWKENTK